MLHILSEVLEMPVYGPDKDLHDVDHNHGGDLHYLRKLKVAAIKRHFAEKFIVMKMCAIV